MPYKCKTCPRMYNYSRKKGNSTTSCNSCYTKKRRKTLKEKLIKLKGGMGSTPKEGGIYSPFIKGSTAIAGRDLLP